MNKQNNIGLSGIVKAAGLALVSGVLAYKVYQHLNKFSLKGKVVLITGGSRGLGLAIAKEAAGQGAKLVLCARTQSQLDKAKHDLEATGATVFTVVTDLTDQQQVSEMVAKCMAHYGRIDVLINNAGVMIAGPQQVMDIDDYKNVMASNVWSALYTTKEILPHFLQQGGGYIVNICSIGGKIAVPHMLPYSVSKFALIGLSEGLNAELAKDNIKVTTVIPSLMRTGSPRNVTFKGNHRAEYAWFKLSDSLPLFSQSAKAAAESIVDALRSGRSEIILTCPGKLAAAIQGTLPGLISAAGRLANRFLPASNDSSGKKGYESESAVTSGIIGSITDKAAVKYNQH